MTVWVITRAANWWTHSKCVSETNHSVSGFLFSPRSLKSPPDLLPPLKGHQFQFGEFKDYWVLGGKVSLSLCCPRLFEANRPSDTWIMVWSTFWWRVKWTAWIPSVINSPSTSSAWSWCWKRKQQLIGLFVWMYWSCDVNSQDYLYTSIRQETQRGIFRLFWRRYSILRRLFLGASVFFVCLFTG